MFLKEYSPYLFELKSNIYIYSGQTTEIPFISKKGQVIVVAKKVASMKKQNFPIQFVYKNLEGWKYKKTKKKKKKKLNLIKKKIKDIIFFLLRYLPFSFEVIVYSYLRGKKIKKINI